MKATMIVLTLVLLMLTAGLIGVANAKCELLTFTCNNPCDEGSITLEWTFDVSGGCDYAFKLERDTGCVGSWQMILLPSTKQTSYTDTGVTQDTAYRVTITCDPEATCGVGNTLYSGCVDCD